MYLQNLLKVMFLFFLLVLPSHSYAELDNGYPFIRWGGYLKNETAYRLREPVSFTKIKNILFLETSVDLRRNLKFFASGWGWLDAVYLFVDYDTVNPPGDPNLPLAFVSQRAEKDDREFYEYREIYFDIAFQNMDLRIGKQIVVWEQLLGFRILDELNPLDFREFILPDLIDFRIPLWTAKADYYAGPNQFELLWIYDIEPHRSAPLGSQWELFQRLPNQIDPSLTIRNSEAGFRFSRVLQGIDLAFSYFYTWDDFPTPIREYTGFQFIIPPQKCLPTVVDFDQPVVDPDCGPVFHPQFHRMNIFGFAMMANLNRVILKGELAYITGKYFGTRLADLDGDKKLDFSGAAKRDHVRWGIEADTRYWGIDFVVAFSQWVIFNHERVFFQNEYDSFSSFFAQKDFMSGSLKGQFFTLYMINRNEALLRPKVGYRMTDNVHLGVGGDFFLGTKETLVADLAAPANDRLFQFLGTFVGRNRVFFEIKYSF